MNSRKLKLFGVFTALSLLAPATSEAYFTTNQSAYKLTDTTALYTVTYKFGFAERGLYMPIMAERDNSDETAQYQAKYQILDQADEVITTGMSNGLVLTSSPDVDIKDGQYYLEPGESASFTLIALLTLNKAAVSETALLVSHLPFTMEIDDKLVPNQLNPSELQYYRTPSVEI